MTNQHAHEPAGHEGAGVHLPDPSVWPIVVGLAALIFGAGIVWWSRDGGSTFAGPLLGAAIVSVLVAAGGWAYEDGRMKRKAESHEPTDPRNARFTQVMTFAVADGKFEAARAADGIVGLIESSDANLRNLAGFQDLRIIAAPASNGPSQVLVETTWSGREGLATYDETRQTILDMVSGVGDQVVPGSVQVFDMEVVRDTKDVSVRFGGAAAATLIGSLAVGGLLIGAGLTLFEGEGGGGGGGEAPAPSGFAQTGNLVARNTSFPEDAISLPPNTEVTIRFDNRDVSPPHNIQFFAGSETSGALLTGCTAGCPAGDVTTPLDSGPIVHEFTFTTPGAGEYAFNCLAHPTQMVGTLTVVDGAPIPGASPAAPPAEGSPAATTGTN